MTELLSIILAAGEGTRMRSATPKVLHPVGGMPISRAWMMPSRNAVPRGSNPLMRYPG